MEKIFTMLGFSQWNSLFLTCGNVDSISFSLVEESAKAQLQNFVRSSAPVIRYVEDLFTSRNLGIDWWREVADTYVDVLI